MDFTLNNEQRAWQMTARKFAEEEIRPISLERDAIGDPRETFDWDIIKKGSKLGFRTMAVPKEWGGARHRFRHPGSGHGGACQGRQRDLEDVQPVLEMEPPDRRRCTDEQKRRFLAPSSRTIHSFSAKGSANPARARTTACRRPTISRRG